MNLLKIIVPVYKVIFMSEFKHKPIMLDKAVDYLRVRTGGLYVDGTIGGGGHSFEICRRLSAGSLIGFDRDSVALEASRQRLSPFSLDIRFVNERFENMKSVLSGFGIRGVDGVILDLGLSSYQLDTPERGFSYRFDAPLDMRMDTGSFLTARDVVNNYSKKQLEEVLLRYGEEKKASAIADNIVKHRPVNTTFELAEIIKKSFSPKERYSKKHYATRTFQALRIEVNDELTGLASAVDSIAGLLNPQGRLIILTFHSLEDRIVKNVFVNLSKDCVCPPEFPVCVCNKEKRYKIITKKPVVPEQDELSLNPRASSCKLRVIEKIL